MSRTRRAAMLGVAVATVAAFGLPLAGLGSPVGADGKSYSLGTWKDPKGKEHLHRWDPCQTITFAVNVRKAGSTPKARSAAAAETREAVRRAGRQLGVTFEFAGRTTEVPRNAPNKGKKWSERQQAAEIVIAWVDQGSKKFRSDLLIASGSGHVAGTGGYASKMWLDGDQWRLAIGRGFVVLNAETNRTLTPGFGSGTTRGALILHEVGHALGLGHAGSTKELMYPTILKRDKTAWGNGDRTGLGKLGQNTGCIPGSDAIWPQI